MPSLSNQQLKKTLLENGFLEEEKLKQAEHIALTGGASLEKVIIHREMLADEELGQIIASELSLPFVNLRNQEISEELMQSIPELFAVENQVLPFKEEEGVVHVATHNPGEAHLIHLLEKKLGKKVAIHYATENDLHQAFNLYKTNLAAKIKELMNAALNKAEASGKKTGEDQEVIKMVDLILEYAYSSKASDIHIEPQEVDTVIRFRVDGVLSDVLNLSKKLHDRIITRFKILARLRTDEHFAAQDGHVGYEFSGEKVDLRLSILPTTFGEKIVLRLLAEKSRQFSLESLGLKEKDFQKLKAQAAKPWGMVLVTGPTGSGKTTTLYAVLKKLNKREVNISTIEDPVEYSIVGVNQIQVNKKTELTFANGLRSIVRQDPDIIMVGEIRDEETADIAVNAALTGHLLLSTLHTNDAATALPRLLDMGVEPFLVASTVNVVIAQRLLRRICMKCIQSYEVTQEQLEAEDILLPEEMKAKLFKEGGKQRFYKGAGCGVCHHTGYLGRGGVFEVLEIDSTMKQMIVDKASADEIKKYAIEKGMTTMFDDAIEKVKEGFTTLEEVLRVVGS